MTKMIPRAPSETTSTVAEATAAHVLEEGPNRLGILLRSRHQLLDRLRCRAQPGGNCGPVAVYFAQDQPSFET